ncbi:hypothetical protein [Nocardia shimofusensis]|uniref:hypothetical protein n=1 Tax=Nocardia shimofusensis TaxID=228596 RepID=UPI000ACD19B6|nr:hypothetical protein [Nocardia shimofusensis]
MDIVLTANGHDFTFDDADALTYEVYGADAFFELIDDSNPALVRTVAQEQLVYWLRGKGKRCPRPCGRQEPGGSPNVCAGTSRRWTSVEFSQLAHSPDSEPHAPRASTENQGTNASGRRARTVL